MKANYGPVKNSLLEIPTCVCGPSRNTVLLILNLFAFIVHTTMGFFVFVSGHPHGKQLEIPIYVSIPVWKNMSLSDGFEYVVQRDDNLGPIRLDVLCGGFSAITASFHLCVAVVIAFYNERYEKAIERCALWWRWAEYSITAPIMMMSLLLVSGVRDRSVMLQTVFLQFVTMWCGWLTEEIGQPDENGKFTLSWKQRLAPYFIGWAAYVPSWVIFLTNFYDASAYIEAKENISPREWIQFLLIGEAVLFTLFAIPLPVYRTLVSPKYYWQTECIYVTLSLASKVVLNGVLLSNVIIAGNIEGLRNVDEIADQLDLLQN